MSAIDRIHDGITSGDWKAVCDGFAMLTGRQLQPPKTEPSESVVVNVPDAFWQNNQFWTGLGERIEVIVREQLAAVTTMSDEDDEQEEEDDEDDEDDPEPSEEEPEPDPVSTRARAVRDASVSGRETDYSKFNVQHGQQQGNKGRTCKVVPFEPGMKNNWQDDGTIAADKIRDSKKLSKKKKPEPRRPPVKTVTVKCAKCDRTEEVNPLFAPKSLDGKDQSSYVCNSCMSKNRR